MLVHVNILSKYAIALVNRKAVWKLWIDAITVSWTIVESMHFLEISITKMMEQLEENQSSFDNFW